MYCLFILVVVAMLDQADKWALPSLQSAGLQCVSCIVNDSFYDNCLEMCLDFSDTQMGVLTGPAMSIMTVIFALPLGWLADRYSRTRILTVGLCIWSTATFLSAYINKFWELAALRVLLGLGAATVNPTTASLVVDYFSEEYQSLVLSILVSMVFLGVDIGLISAVISQNFGWRIVYTVLGGFGIGMAPIVGLTVWDPYIKREINAKTEQKKNYSVLEVIKHIFKEKYMIMVFISCAIRFTGGYSLGVWMQVFYRRVFGLTPTQITAWLAVIIPVCGMSGAYTGGFLADYLHKKIRGGKAILVTISCFLGLLTSIPAFLYPDYKLSFAFLALSFFTAEMWNGPALSIVCDQAKPGMVSSVTAIFYSIGSIGSVGPFILGFLIEQFKIIPPFHHANNAGYDPTYPMLIMVSGNYFLSFVGFCVASILMNNSTTETFCGYLTDYRNLPKNS
eukprot:TRINITY_DN840_c0_g1_i7.p1 TRINITY_DN840_c0_g1~~TRINITY_DN840_c0_g1_i7.p1  ORF type:complete len:449 (-),score=63.72 TRINITY_DN840_c0_g1_i7:906-2252(-)